MQRIMIIGCSGSGKSTLGRRMAKITGLPLFHTDQILWREGWVVRPREEVRRGVRNVADKSCWIFDGANGSTLDIRIARADTLIVLDLPTYICLIRILKRVIGLYGKTRDDMPNGCPERFDWEFMKWIFNYRKTNLSRDLALLNNAPAGVTRFHFKDQKSVDQFVKNLSASRN